MAILTVGTGQQFTTIHDAVAAARDGDDVQIKAGTYTNDFSYVGTKITVEGVGGVVHLVATVPPSDGKSIMTVGATATLRNLDFSGAKVPDANGAGIRWEGGDLTIDHCSFHDNENGLLGANMGGANNLTVTNSTFNHNGNGNGLTHNIYVGMAASFTATGNTFENAHQGHELKSRAQVNTITNNTFSDGTSDPSYSIDLPNGGAATISGNTIEKGPNAPNYTIIHYGGESIPYVGSSLMVKNNTFTNDLHAGSAIAIRNETLVQATISGNSFGGNAYGAYVSGKGALTHNTGPGGAALPDSTLVNLPGGGNTQYFTDKAAHTLTFAGTGLAAVGGAGRLTATGPSHETVVGGAGGLSWTGQGGADAITTAANSANTIKLGGANSQLVSQGNDSITGTTANDQITINGRATVNGGTGNSSYAINGAATVTGHSSGNEVFVIGGPSARAQISDGTFIDLTNNGGQFALRRTAAGATVTDAVTVTGGAETLKSFGSDGNHITVASGSKGAEIDCGTGQNHIKSLGAPDTIRAGSGTTEVIVTGQAQIYQGTGLLNVFGSGDYGGATVHGAAGHVTFGGDTGRITYLAAATGAATIDAYLSRNTFRGSAGLLTVNANIGGTGNTTFGGAGGIILDDAVGGQTVTTKAGSKNTLSLNAADGVTSHGADTISVGADNNAIVADGKLDFVGGAGGAVITNNGAATVTGSAGNVSLVGGGTLLFRGGTGTAELALGAGAATVVAGAGALTVAAGAGHTVLEFIAGAKPHGAELVTGFDAARDTIKLDGYAKGSAKVAAVSGGTQLTLSDGTQVMFAGVSKLVV